MESLEVKTLPLAELKIDGGDSEPGEFTGRASSFNGVDAYGDTIVPGAYEDTIPQFLERGFIGWGHDWSDPIGYVTDAEERSTGLYIKGRFHSDADSQKYRLRAKERAEAGKFMGLSIGFVAQEWEMREEGSVRALTKIHLYETSLVTVPADAGAALTAIKSNGLKFAEELERVLAASQSAASRAEELVTLRTTEGRTLSDENWTRISALASEWESLVTRLNSLAPDEEQEEPPASIEPPEDTADPELRRLFEEFRADYVYYRGSQSIGDHDGNPD
jgi:uncharacterized protein